jgi:O-methyltransferase
MQNDERLITLFQQAVFCEKNEIPGAFVECGVWKGGAVGLMALANLTYGKKRRDLHLFDSFQDICEPDEDKDGKRLISEIRAFGGIENKLEGNLKAIEGFYDTMGGCGTLEGNKNLMENIVGYDTKYTNYHVGWFQETLPIATPQINQIAILRLDGDLYDSIKVCLDHLYKKVVSGGFIIIDDYFYYKGCTDAVDDFLKENKINVYLHHADYASKYHAYWVKP